MIIELERQRAPVVVVSHQVIHIDPICLFSMEKRDVLLLMFFSLQNFNVGGVASSVCIFCR